MQAFQLLSRIIFLVSLLSVATIARSQTDTMKAVIDSPHLMSFLVVGLVVTALIMIFSNFVYYFREKKVNKKAQLIISQLGLVLHANRTQVWTYDLKQRIYRRLTKDGISDTRILPLDFAKPFDRDDFIQLRDLMNTLGGDGRNERSIMVRGREPQSENEQRELFQINLSILHQDKTGQPSVILGVQRDVTNEKRREEQQQELYNRFHTVFNSSLIDMISFDADGTMTDINDKACETYHVKNRKELLAGKPTIKSFPCVLHTFIDGDEPIFSSSITKTSEVKYPIGDISTELWGDTIYLEQQTTPIHDRNGKLAGVMMAGRDISEMVNSQHRQLHDAQLLEQSNREVSNYINNINYSLRVSKVQLLNYYPDTHEMVISNDLNNESYRFSQLRCMSVASIEERKKCNGLFRRMDNRREGMITTLVRTELRDKKGRNIYLNFNIIPSYDKEHYITHYFGMCRDETEMVYTELKLREETEKAQETEQLKKAFLLNMSYELRTPLNAVLGFAELYNNEHNTEDEPVFAQEIKKNTNELLKLINDILYISRLDAHMEEFSHETIDFAPVFESYCYMGWSAISPKTAVHVDNPYNHLMVIADEHHLGEVIEKLCAYSAFKTPEGSIRAFYEYRQGELMITINDTGEGIAEADLPHVFDRFRHDENERVYDTGLTLAIIKEIIEQMGGAIEIQSEKGKGTAALVSIPCELVSYEKK